MKILLLLIFTLWAFSRLAKAKERNDAIYRGEMQRRRNN